MAFYDLNKEDRKKLVASIKETIETALAACDATKILVYFADTDTYIRKSAYLCIGSIYSGNRHLMEPTLQFLKAASEHNNFHVRQTAINAAGEIGKHDFKTVQSFFDAGLFDSHHAPRNAVIGSIKKMGEVNPVPVLKWARGYLQHPDKEIRREICHGIELRGRKYPQDILPLLKTLQFDHTARVRNTLVHVLGQIAYKKGCLETVLTGLKGWDNEKLVHQALEEIIDVHHRYRNFSFYTGEQARVIVKNFYPQLDFIA